MKTTHSSDCISNDSNSASFVIGGPFTTSRHEVGDVVVWVPRPIEYLELWYFEVRRKQY